MTIGNDSETINSQPVFTAELKPHRSLGKTGFRVLMALTFVLCFFNAIFFMVTGALPVAMFFGIDFILLYGAFWLNYRSARARERIMLSRTELEIHKVSPAGRITRSLYSPFWARFDVARHEEYGITSMAVTGKGRYTPVGMFLGADERESFARAFTSALATVKRRI
ncbi:DUF2244 domain-containing protein [Rhizobium sp. KVB221]|uniref:DUF2244 domain-containing protein n=1 Tax=Rhizobium setariae TaxID=2801340 RepID=A0A936YHV6_9HYPH|nr:DUF2244 domain-containing protein [Rhizobium setariae]MBL0370514.1 DUF2244 domain-containing protein [Rhizobium setariae]